MKHNILLIDDEPSILTSMSGFLSDEGFFVKAVGSGSEGVALIRQKTIPVSLALIDYHMPYMNGVEVIKEIRKYNKDLSILAFSGDDSIQVHNESLDSGAIFFVSKETADAKLLGIIHRICKEIERNTKPLQISNPSKNFKMLEELGIIGASDKMAEVGKLIHKYGPTDETVLIRGENGTGKELVAKALHQNSKRALQRFIAINSTAIPENLIESELFGHEKGAFTGANNVKVGKFQAANGGTIFFDEIGDMPLHLQAKLLRVIQEREITPVGSNVSKKVDVRILAATNAPLEDLIQKRLFREDLFYRLNVLPIKVPPLRERSEDIPYLVEYFLSEANQRAHKSTQILESSIEALVKLKWPGNVRELQNEILRLVNSSEGPFLNLKDLSHQLSENKIPTIKTKDYDSLKFKNHIAEKQLIEEALKKSANPSAAARLLGMKRSTFRDKLKKFGIFIEKEEPNNNEEATYE